MYVKILVFVLGFWFDVDAAPLPLRLTIDCGVYDENTSLEVGISRIHKSQAREVDRFCKQIINLIPKALENGKFVLIKHQDDLNLEGDTLAPSILAAPNFVKGTPNFIKGTPNFVKETPNFGEITRNFRNRAPKLKISRINIPKISVPKLEIENGTAKAPKIGSTRIPDYKIKIPVLKQSIDDDSEVELSSAEKIEKFKKSVRKMLRVVKVLSQVDQYLTERMRLFVDKLSKTFDV